MSDLERLVEEIRRWGYSADGFAAHYEKYRPQPAAVLLELLPWLAGVERPGLVVDLGAGTGLSTRFWADHADAVVGVEPNPEMLAVAVAATEAPNVSYRQASSYETGLADGCADIVTCSQSLQWMEPEPAFAEITRIVRPGGLFAAYEYRWSVTTSAAADAAFEEVFARKARLRDELGLDRDKERWPVERERLEQSGRFRFVDETRVHGIEEITAERLVGFSLSEGSMTTLLAAGVTEEQVGLDRLREIAAAELGDQPSPWYIGYRVVLGRT